MAIATDPIFDTLGDIPVGTGPDSASKMVIGLPFQLPRVNVGASSLEYAGGMSLISDTVVGVGGVASIDIQNIPQTYKNLYIFFSGRSSGAGTVDTFACRFNNDSGNNYQVNYEQVAATSNHQRDFSLSTLTIGACPASGSPAGSPAVAIIVLFNYANTTLRKVGTSQSESGLDGTTYQIFGDNRSLKWHSTSGINRITLYALGGNLVQNSRVTLYGVS